MPLTYRSLVTLLILCGPVACRSTPAEPPVEPQPEVGHVFTYVAPPGAPALSSLSVRGSFNSWGQTAMTRRADGAWRALIPLDAGTYEYKFFINGAWPPDMCDDRTWGDPQNDYWIDPDADGCVPDGHDGYNAVVIIGGGADPAFSHAPDDPAHVSAAGGQLSIRFRVQRGQVQSATVTTSDDSFPMHLQLTDGVWEIWRAALPEGTTGYAFALQTAAGSEDHGPYAVPANLFRSVPWVGEAIGYQIFPERFWNGDPGNDQMALETDVVHYMDPRHWSIQPVLMEQWGGDVLDFHCCHQYFGGDLQGILDRLDHLQALGVTLIYLNPIFTSGSAHGYDTYDHLEVAPNFGDEALLRQLLVAARARGMRLMWDFVPNHVGVGHWAFQHAVEHGEASPYWNWFRFRVPGNQVEVGHGGHYDGWWGFGSLPVLETRNPEVFEHLIEVTRHWTEFGFDGIRVDVPNEVLNRSEFFSAFRRAAKALNPEVYLVGEIWGRDASWLQGDQFDALMNYAIGEAVIERFAGGDLSGSAASREMAQLYAEYPEASAAMKFNLISSHDTGRLLTKVGGGPLGGTPGATALAHHRLASAVLYALPGMPVTFQGDECAFLGTGEGPREENRYPMQWDVCDGAMVAHYSQLAELKRSLDAFSSPVIRSSPSAGPLLAFYRGEPGAGEVLAIFNNAQTPQSVTLPEGVWVDAVTRQSLSGSVLLEPLGWRYLRRN
jgi:cyclomaltodextrinase / maltogenic alpha-amylase / neopullulanase